MLLIYELEQKENKRKILQH